MVVRRARIAAWALALGAMAASTSANAQFYDTYGNLPSIWQGAYAGITGGGGFGGFDFGNTRVSAAGPLAGIHAGYNATNGSLVFGIESDAMFTGIKAHAATTWPTSRLEAGPSYLGSVRARIGVTSGPALFYGTGGLAVTVIDAKASYAGTTATGRGAFPGYVVGIGTEYQITPQWGVRFEALHYRFSDVAKSTNLPGVNFDATVIRSGFNWRF
jgi:outer membrane immunogenic protein